MDPSPHYARLSQGESFGSISLLTLDDWVFEIEEISGEQITDQLMEVYNNYDDARRKLESSWTTSDRSTATR